MTKEDSEIKSKVERKDIKSTQKSFWIWLKYFAMKWRFRLDQARTIFGLITFAALLASSYIASIPWFKDQHFWRGEFFLTIIVFIVFMIGGYLYDRFLKLWTETAKVTVERNPYTYVPQPKELIVTLGWWVHIFSMLKQIADKLEIELEGEEMIKQQLKYYLSLSAEDTDFEIQARKLQRLTALILEDYLESESIGDFDEYMKDLELYFKKKKNLIRK